MKLLSLILAFSLQQGGPPLEISEVFSSNMVLQAGKEIPVWGWAGPNSKINVRMDTLDLNTVAAENGSWRLVMPPFAYGGSYTMTISSGHEKVELTNVVFGDVWICAGQSNMRFELYRSAQGREAIAGAAALDIRHLKVQERYSETELERVETSEWQVAGSVDTKNFTAVGYYFATKVFAHTGHPIGLLNITRGGSRIETWMPKDYFPEGHLVNVFDSVASLQKESESQLVKDLGYSPQNLSKQELESLWKHIDLGASWIEHQLPGRWEDQGLPNLDGQVYYAKDFWLKNLNATEKRVELHLATIDDADSVWLNGRFIGATTGWDRPRKYSFSVSLLKEGNNRLLVKVNDISGSGGIRGNPDDVFISTGTEKIDLSGAWKFKVAELNYTSPVRPRHVPTLFFNAMVHPLTQLPVKGIIWYQAENNARSVADAHHYRDQFQQLIIHWRRLFKDEGLPFLFVQLPNYDANGVEEDAWAVMRESQRSALNLPHTGMAVTIDLGTPDDIHPTRKKEVGARLAGIALSRVYGQRGFSNLIPEAKKAYLNGQVIEIEFSGGELSSQDSEALKGFELGGADGSFVNARAKIWTKNKIRVWSDEPDRFDRVRFAWANDPEMSFIYNQYQIPLSTFSLRIDHD